MSTDIPALLNASAWKDLVDQIVVNAVPLTSLMCSVLVTGLVIKGHKALAHVTASSIGLGRLAPITARRTTAKRSTRCSFRCVMAMALVSVKTIHAATSSEHGATHAKINFGAQRAPLRVLATAMVIVAEIRESVCATAMTSGDTGTGRVALFVRLASLD